MLGEAFFSWYYSQGRERPERGSANVRCLLNARRNPTLQKSAASIFRLYCLPHVLSDVFNADDRILGPVLKDRHNICR